MKTTKIRIQGQSVKAYAERQSDGSVIVRAWDDVAGHYSVTRTMTEGQRRYVIGRTLAR